MSSIETYLQYIASKVWAREVRTAIVNAIRQCYDDVHNPTLNTEALQAAIQAKIDAGQMAALTIGDRTITAAKLALGVIPTPDTTLSQSGVPADAKKTGDEITAINESLGNVQAGLGALEPGLSDEAKEVLLECFDHVAFYGDTSVDYYSELESALFPEGRPTVLKLSDVVSSKGVNGWIQKKFLRLSAPPVREFSEASMTYTTVNCSAGDMFKINAVGAAGGRAWGFLNNNNEVISVADENVTVTNLIITAPANAVKLVIHNKGNGVSHGSCYKVEREEITNGWIQKKYLMLTGTSVNEYANAIMTYVLLDCSAGDKFIVNAIGAAGGRAWGFLNSNNEVISMADENVTVTNLELTAPANAVKLVIHNKNDGVSHGTCYKVEQKELTGFVVDESGNMKYSAVAQYSVIELDASITKIKFFENTDISNPGTKPWFIFRKVDSNTFYGTDGTNLYVFAWDASTGKYNATRDNSIATISATNLSSFVLPQKRELFIKNGVATLKNDNGGIISVSNANVVSIWDQNADYTYESVRVKR